MKTDNIILNKSYNFALDIIQLHMYLTKELNEYILSKQLLRSGTSIGANVEEAIGGISRRDFRAKMSIAYKEARETHYWLRLLIDSKIVTSEKGIPLKNKCEELRKILSSILKTLNS
ncbi:MAG: four helix bundle protein [Bacteroidota bacterium]